jgi:hypothetical protein
LSGFRAGKNKKFALRALARYARPFPFEKEAPAYLTLALNSGSIEVSEQSDRQRNGEIMSEPRYPDVVVQLTGNDGNAFTILATIQKALKRAGVEKSEVDAYFIESTSGDYDHLIRTAMSWVTVK